MSLYITVDCNNTRKQQHLPSDVAVACTWWISMYPRATPRIKRGCCMYLLLWIALSKFCYDALRGLAANDSVPCCRRKQHCAMQPQKATAMTVEWGMLFMHQKFPHATMLTIACQTNSMKTKTSPTSRDVARWNARSNWITTWAQYSRMSSWQAVSSDSS